MKTAIAWIAVILAILLLAPIPGWIKNGYTIHLQPIIPTYSVYIHNSFSMDENGNVEGRIKGCTVEILGITVYDHTYFVAEE